MTESASTPSPRPARRIGDVDLQRTVLVIAEIGNNHEGDVGLAREMIALAAEAGAGAVKFQSIDPAQLVSPRDAARFAQLQRFQLDPGDTERLADEARARGVLFLSTPFSLDAVGMLDPLVPAFKIASGDNDFVPLLETVAATGKPVLLSCGLADLAGIEASQAVVRRVWRARGLDAFVVLLHCVSAYPTPLDEANLRAIPTLANHAEVVGYSDHTLGIEAAVAAVALGARVVEKHFTSDKQHSSFRDHQLSADQAELRALCARVADVHRLLGDGSAAPRPSEAPLQEAARRSIAAARDLPAGAVLAAGDLTWLRPGGGIAPGREVEVVGRTLRRDVRAGDPIDPEDLAG